MHNIAPEITVVIPVRNGADTIGEQLAALAQQDIARDLEVIVADNGSTDATMDVAFEFAPSFSAFKAVDASDALGAAHARNIGAREARGEKLLFCDADDVVAPGWVAALAGALDCTDAAGGRARLDRINTAEAADGREFVSDALGAVFEYLPYALSGTLGVRRETYLALGGFDTSFPRGHEEVDFAWRLQHAGYTLGWAPEAIVDYRQRSGIRSLLRQNFNYAESSIQLWARFATEHPLAPVSFSGSVRNVLQQALRSHRLLSPRTRRDQVKALGWTAGVLAGHLRYRKFGSPPPPRLMERPS